MRRTVLRPLASLLVGLVLVVSTVTPTLGWANGGGGGNGYGTHDWIISQAVKAFGDAPPAWLDVDAALLASDDPDKLFWATNEHVFYEKGYGRGAVDRISEFFHQALTAHLAGDDQQASIAFGWMAHYYGDILQPYHTNYAGHDLDDSHLHYELLVDKLTKTPDAAPDWMTVGRTPGPVGDVRTSAIAAAAYSRSFLPELHRTFSPNETVLLPRVMEITGLLLKRASSDLADLLYSIDQGVGEATAAASVTARVRYRYAAKNSTQTIYATVKDAAGRPLQGVRIDIAFPNPAGGTRLIRRYTTSAGTATADAAIGAIPFGNPRDVVITVKTGDVVKAPATWFMTSRRLATGRAGFRSWVDDTTVYPGQTIHVGSHARGTSARPVPNVRVTYTWTFSNGKAVTTTSTTNAAGKTLTGFVVKPSTPKGRVRVVARIQSGSVSRTSTAVFRIY